MTLHKMVASNPKSCQNNYNGIDIVKFLCAIMVFIIHIAPLRGSLTQTLSPVENEINFWLQNYLCRLAVPFYFVCSGFFFFKKMPSNGIDVNRVKKYCFRIIYLLGVWNVLLFLGGKGHLWYLGATVVAVAFLSICLSYHVDFKFLVIIACVFYVLGLLGDSYLGLIEPFVSEGILNIIYGIYNFFVSETRNGFYMGYIFVLMGYIFAQGKVKIKPQVSLVFFCTSMICLFVEVFILRHYSIPDDYNMYIFLVPATFFLFAFVSSLSINDRPIYIKLRTVGTLVYFLHILINELTAFGTSMFYGAFKIALWPFQFFISLPVTLLIAFGIEWLSHKEKFNWINWFIS